MKHYLDLHTATQLFLTVLKNTFCHKCTDRTKCPQIGCNTELCALLCHCVCMYTVHLSNQIKRDRFSVFNHPKLDKAAFRIKQLTKINIHNFYNFNLQLKLGLVSLTTYCLSNLHNSEMLSKCRQTFSFCLRYFQKPSHSSRGQTSSTGKLKDNFSEKCFSNVMQ